MTTLAGSTAPEPLAGLIEAARLGLLIPFIGAGASRVAGCPGWDEFADRALRYLIGTGKFTHAQLDQIKGLPPRVKLSLAKSLSQEHSQPIDYREVLYQGSELRSQDGHQLYRALLQLGKTFVTTNYDEWLDTNLLTPVPQVSANAASGSADTAPKWDVVHGVDRLSPRLLSTPNTVIHLHGSVKNPSEMVITTQDYIRHYANDRKQSPADKENVVLTFLQALFWDRKTVLFIGYGLEELEILEYVIGKAGLDQKRNGSVQIRHYILQGFFSHEEELQRTLGRYYLENGIRLIPFSRDERDWKQLIFEIERLAAIMQADAPGKAERLIGMEAMLRGYPKR